MDSLSQVDVRPIDSKPGIVIVGPRWVRDVSQRHVSPDSVRSMASRDLYANEFDEDV
jgi:hypothetical protein